MEGIRLARPIAGWRVRFVAGVLSVVGMPLILAAVPQGVQSGKMQHQADATPLATLIEELRKSSPAVLAAQSTAKAATYQASQVSSLPDPQFTLQQLSVGSPRPFAGYTNSDFAYIGIGASQQIPYPGKLRLRGELADREADTVKAHADVVFRDEVEQLKTVYAQLAYLQETLEILRQDDTLLHQIEQQASDHYSTGQGNQQDVLKAQLERTKLLREISMHHQQVGEAQAELKRILRRSQDSPDITTEPLTATLLQYTADELLEKVRMQNPVIAEGQTMVKRNQTAVELAQKEFRPDFNVSYMYQNTDRKFRDFYMLTVSVDLPRRKPREAALAQSKVNVERSKQELDGELQAALAAVQKHYVMVKATEEQLLIYRDGLIPQSQATIQSGLAAYQANREDFQTVLSSFVDGLNLNLEYQQTLLDHETAVVQIERLTGVTLP